ncbi:MAG TPA: hypothetical protein VGX28_08290 [Frankiaceae bacterium]|jgi:ABC-type branched-subunit amino acid transport system permease subunit|nr:hypothetical protein [Frankiaceae bacterium]
MTLRLAAGIWAATILVHTADHARRGLDTSPKVVIALGGIAFAFQAVAIVAALLRHALAPLLAVAVAVPDALGVVAVHLLPRWSGLSDAFPGAPASANVTAFSWATAVAEVAAAVLFAVVAARQLPRATRRGGAATAGRP